MNTPLIDVWDWKVAMRDQLDRSKISRYRFVREVEAAGICTRHTAECLLADSGTVTGNRVPSLSLAIQIANLAGYDVVLVRRGKAKVTR